MSKRAEANRIKRWNRKGREDQRARSEFNAMLAQHAEIDRLARVVIVPVMMRAINGERR